WSVRPPALIVTVSLTAGGGCGRGACSSRRKLTIRWPACVGIIGLETYTLLPLQKRTTNAIVPRRADLPIWKSDGCRLQARVSEQQFGGWVMDVATYCRTSAVA